MARLIFGYCLLSLLLTTAWPAFGQDAQYWDNQYGTRAQLLGGLVVGSSSDLSATYYNPGWIAMDAQPALLLTTKAAEYYQLKIIGGYGEGVEPVSQKFSPSPGFMAAQLKQDLDRRLTIAFSYLEKTNFRYQASGYRIDSDPTPPPDGSYWFAGEAFKKSEVSEQWAGVTMSWKLNDTFAVGVTPYGILRNHSKRFQGMAQAMNADGNYAAAYHVDSMEFWHVRMLAKAGLAVDLGTYTMGLTLTTPGVGLFGTGTVYRNESVDGVDLDGDDLPDTYLATNRQADLAASYASPLSVAAGVSRNFGPTGVHFSLEWFNSVGSRGIMDTAPYQTQSDGTEMHHETGYAMRRVLNWGLGVDHVFSSRFALYGSFRTDYSALDTNTSSDVIMSSWNLWHSTLGASFTWLEIEFTTGLDFTQGSGFNNRYISYNPETDVLGDYQDVEMRYSKLKFLIGLNLPFSTSG